MKQILTAYENFNNAETAVRDLMKSRFTQLLKDINWENPMKVLMDGYTVYAWLEGNIKFDFDGLEYEFDDLQTDKLFRILETIDEK